MGGHAFAQLLALLGTAVAVLAAFRALRLPAVLGYLLVGVLVGPHGLGWLPDTEFTRTLAELGVVFLLFTVGLEFSLPELLAQSRATAALGALQILITAALGAAVAAALGLPWGIAAVLGGAAAMSSTAIVVRQLGERLELGTRHGRAVVAVLLLQDLATLPFLVLASRLGGAGTAAGADLVQALAVAPLVVAGLYLGGRWLAQPFLAWVGGRGSGELFMLAAILVVIAAAGLAGQAGLSAPLGAFVAGMVLGETEFRHQVEEDIRPFRDVLLGLFFATIGMLVDPRAVLAQAGPVLALAAALVAGKGLLVLLLGRLVGQEWGVALRAGLCLAHAGEFGLLLVSQAIGRGALAPAAGQVLLGGFVLSMVAAPVLVHYNGALARRLGFLGYARALRAREESVAAEARHLEGHVVIAGYGRIGQNVVRLLEEDGIPCLALDLDPGRVREAREAGDRVVYGDATREGILRAAGVERARLLVVSFADDAAALRTVEHARRLAPELPIVVRTRDDRHLEALLAAGATEVLPEGLETSLMIGAQVLLLLGVPDSEVTRRIAAVRADDYRLLRRFFHGHEADEPPRGAYLARLHAVPLPARAWAVGRTIEELDLGRLGVELAAVRRGGIKVPAPALDTRLREGDVLILSGEPEALERAEARILRG